MHRPRPPVVLRGRHAEFGCIDVAASPARHRGPCDAGGSAPRDSQPPDGAAARAGPRTAAAVAEACALGAAARGPAGRRAAAAAAPAGAAALLLLLPAGAGGASTAPERPRRDGYFGDYAPSDLPGAYLGRRQGPLRRACSTGSRCFGRPFLSVHVLTSLGHACLPDHPHPDRHRCDRVGGMPGSRLHRLLRGRGFCPAPRRGAAGGGGAAPSRRRRGVAAGATVA
mmetsp:Transcript_123384/g.354500  ORF Transcript_123384/g.354500 Transcript_123384/m.354500 type:complete len:226 (+) Transcript_123384:448-1125(+)